MVWFPILFENMIERENLIAHLTTINSRLTFLEGDPVGSFEGDAEGLILGDAEGFLLGARDGDILGDLEGMSVTGDLLGAEVGSDVGCW